MYVIIYPKAQTVIVTIMLISNDEFLVKVQEMMDKSKCDEGSGTFYVTMKRYTYKSEQVQCLFRAKCGNDKISTLVNISIT
jgi:hypothetical protein